MPSSSGSSYTRSGTAPTSAATPTKNSCATTFPFFPYPALGDVDGVYFFSIYFAQGLQRTGLLYLRSQVTDWSTTGTDAPVVHSVGRGSDESSENAVKNAASDGTSNAYADLSRLNSVLPGIGSAVWLLRPFFCLLAERGLGIFRPDKKHMTVSSLSRRTPGHLKLPPAPEDQDYKAKNQFYARCYLTRYGYSVFFLTSVIGLGWILLSLFEFTAHTNWFFVCVAVSSIPFTCLDGLIDGQCCRLTAKRKNSEYSLFCEWGRVLGALLATAVANGDVFWSGLDLMVRLYNQNPHDGGSSSAATSGTGTTITEEGSIAGPSEGTTLSMQPTHDPTDSRTKYQAVYSILGTCWLALAVSLAVFVGRPWEQELLVVQDEEQDEVDVHLEQTTRKENVNKICDEGDKIIEPENTALAGILRSPASAVVAATDYENENTMLKPARTNKANAEAVVVAPLGDAGEKEEEEEEEVVVEPDKNCYRSLRPGSSGSSSIENSTAKKKSLNNNPLLAGAITSLVLVCPDADFFLFRKHVLDMTPGGQSICGNLGTVGWIVGLWVFRTLVLRRQDDVEEHQHRGTQLELHDDKHNSKPLTKPRTPSYRLPQQCRTALLLWLLISTLPWFFYTHVHVYFSVFEKLFSECARCCSFMLCNLLMQHAVAVAKENSAANKPKSKESSPSSTDAFVATKFAVLQGSGAVALFVARNVDFYLLDFFEIKTFQERSFSFLLCVYSLARICCAFLILFLLVPRLQLGINKL
ncbi:unnamed protein product [Amoebophrya sp. A120]|nr:unnamed protein product [Amoebophrya sp. A120]|eukprot:GSA120T00012014001.1